MQSSKEQQGEKRKPSSANNAKKQRKTIEWGKLLDYTDMTSIAYNYIIEVTNRFKGLGL